MVGGMRLFQGFSGWPRSCEGRRSQPLPMKPNILVVQPSRPDADAAIDCFCEALSGSHYVYLIRPLSGHREDSPAGVRFLNFSPDHLPGFGEVESVIVVDGIEHTSLLQKKYPAARHWHLDSEDAAVLELTDAPAPDATIIEGDFGVPVYQERARAV